MAARKSGPKKTPQKKRVTFRFEDGQAQEVAVAGSFSEWDKKPVELKRDGNGNWKATLLLPPGRYEYRFLVDGQWRDDPNCSERVSNSFGTANCVIDVPGQAAG